MSTISGYVNDACVGIGEMHLARVCMDYCRIPHESSLGKRSLVESGRTRGKMSRGGPAVVFRGHDLR